MTGRDERSWNWSHSALVPALLAVTEAAWFSLCVSAAANATRGLRMDLPYLAFALPAVAAVALSSAWGRLPWRRWVRVATLAILVLVGIAVTAGLISELTRSGSFAAVAGHPWTVSGRIPSDVSELAWFSATVAWLRGTWLGSVEVSFRHAGTSIGVSVIAFAVLLIVLASRHHPVAGVSTAETIGLFVLFFAGGIAALALLREREIETEVLRRSGRPNTVWLSVLGVPLAVIAGIALLVAVVAAGLASLVGRGLRVAGRGVGRAVLFLARELADIFPKVHPHPIHVTVPKVRGRPVAPPPVHAGAHSVVPIGVWVAIIVVVGIGLLVLLILLVRHFLPSLSVRRPAPEAVDEERESLFTWRHVMGQLRAWWSRLLGRFRRRTGPEVLATVVPTSVSVLEGSGVRHEYRRVLRAARGSGHGRAHSETAFEFGTRLEETTVGRDGPTAAHLRRLTLLYAATRYGGLRPDGPAEEAATRSSTALVDLLDRERSNPDDG